MHAKSIFIYFMWGLFVFAAVLTLLIAFGPRADTEVQPWPTVCAPDGSCTLATQTPEPTWLPETATAVYAGWATYQAGAAQATPVP